jgi:hypothetical protein
MIRSPADAWLAVRMAGWSIALPVLKHTLPLPRLGRLMWQGRTRGDASADVERIVELSRHVARIRPWHDRNNCLERSLIAFRYLSAAKADPRFVMGVRPARHGVEGHAWVEVDGEPLLEGGDIATFVPLVVFGDGGRREEVPAPPATDPPPL